MSKYHISEKEIKKRKRSPYWGIVWGVVVAIIIFLQNPDSLFVSLGVGAGFGLFIASLGWYQNKHFLKFADEHELLLNEESLVFSHLGSQTILQVSAISKVYVNINKKNVPVSITINCNGTKSRLSAYANLSELAKDLEKLKGAQCIEYRKWIHV